MNSVKLNCYKEYLMLIKLFKKYIYIILLFYFVSSVFITTCKDKDTDKNPDSEVDINMGDRREKQIPVESTIGELIPVNFKSLSGNWNLLYGNDYGYNFKFYKNYRAIVILYLNTNSIVFKGVYNVESNDSIRINISEMKREENVKNIDLKKGFVKAKSSHFVFNTRITKNGEKKYLELKAQEIFIDGSNSDGYFEPYIKLDYLGK